MIKDAEMAKEEVRKIIEEFNKDRGNVFIDGCKGSIKILSLLQKIVKKGKHRWTIKDIH